MKVIDSHCHLDFKEFEEDFKEVLERAKNNNVIGMQTICTKISEFNKIISIADKEKNIWCSIGIHPHNTEKEKISLEQIYNLYVKPQVQS